MKNFDNVNKVAILLPLLIVFVVTNQDADATHTNQSSECNISLSAYVLPVYYNAEQRGNPDNTFYPGDGFHYLFTFRGSDTCIGFTPETIKSEGAFDLISHNVIRGSDFGVNQKNNHPHDDLNMVPKYLTTKHYYVDKIIHVACGFGRCRNVIPAESPSFSIREGQTIPSQLQKLFEGSHTASTYSLRTEETQSWGFAKIGKNHGHGDEYIYEDSHSIDSFEESMKNFCNNFQKNAGCVFGHAEIDTKVVQTRCLIAELAKMGITHDLQENEDVCVDVTDSISLTVKGIKIKCDDRKCKSVTVKKNAEIKPNILEPGNGINLLKNPLPDTSGYDAKNLDGTYYLHDPLSVVHVPDFKWKNKRAETIQFSTEKKYDLKEEYDYDCNENSCDLFLEHSGVKPHTVQLGNGDGITIYNATSDEFLGNHTFDYSVNVYNMDRKINSMHENTGALVVRYDPQYTSYPYPRIADDQRYSFDDRQASALHYFGSDGGGPDDIPGTHQERRSKINDFYHTGFMYDPWNPALINKTFAWSASENTGVIPEINTLGLDIIPGKNPQIIPFESNGNVAMFIRSGYGKIFFDYPLSSVLFDNKTGAAKYENATSYVTLLSRNFAGKETTYLVFWEFTAPEASFVTNLTVKTINQNGTITDNPIHVTAVPKLKKGAAYLTDYLDEKITYDSKDKGLAQVIVDDAYPMKFDYFANGIIDEKLRRTASQFQQFEDISYETNSDADGIFKLSEDYLKESKESRLKIPLEVGLAVLSPTDITIDVNGKTKTIDAQFIDFGTNREILINVENNNVLETKRGLGFLNIIPDEHFGGIEKISVNDKVVDIACLTGCAIPVDKTSPLKITVWNEWGGASHASLPEYTITKTPKTSFDGISLIAGLLALFALAYVLYKKINPKK